MFTAWPVNAEPGDQSSIYLDPAPVQTIRSPERCLKDRPRVRYFLRLLCAEERQKPIAALWIETLDLFEVVVDFADTEISGFDEVWVSAFYRTQPKINLFWGANPAVIGHLVSNLV